MRPRPLRVRTGVPGDDERGAPAAERERGPQRGVQPVRVHEIGVRAGHPQRGHGGRITAARHGNVLGTDATEPVREVGLGR